MLRAAWRCTGTQIDADTFLTAGHCTFDADAVAIWYGEDLTSLQSDRDSFVLFSAAKQAADAYTENVDGEEPNIQSHPDYDDDLFFLNDVGVVDGLTVTNPVGAEAYGTLPEPDYWNGQIDALRKDRDAFTTVGYGLQRSLPRAGGADALTEFEWTRLQAHGVYLGYRQFGGGADNDFAVILSNNAHTGGTCSGDSGGPTFIDDTQIIVGITSFGVNVTCAGTGGIYRIDTADDLKWIMGFLDTES